MLGSFCECHLDVAGALLSSLAWQPVDRKVRPTSWYSHCYATLLGYTKTHYFTTSGRFPHHHCALGQSQQHWNIRIFSLLARNRKFRCIILKGALNYTLY